MPAIASLRRWLQVGLAGLSVILLTACGALPASAATILLLNPNSIRAGFQIEIRATCGDNTNPAFVGSAAFGSVTLVPSHGVLRENVSIPASTRSGTYTVSLECASGQQSSAKLTVINGGRPNPNHGPHTGGGEMAASTGGRLALLGGLGALVAGVGLWLLSGLRRRTPVA
jgi:hypothetical protein